MGAHASLALEDLLLNPGFRKGCNQCFIKLVRSLQIHLNTCYSCSCAFTSSSSLQHLVKEVLTDKPNGTNDECSTGHSESSLVRVAFCLQVVEVLLLAQRLFDLLLNG